jgi:uncharacterized protein YijF (DUF1287 family)
MLTILPKQRKRVEWKLSEPDQIIDRLILKLETALARTAAAAVTSSDFSETNEPKVLKRSD